MIELRILRGDDYPGLSRRTLIAIHKSSDKGEQREIWETHNRRCEDRDRNWSNGAYTPRNTDSLRNLKEARNKFSPNLCQHLLPRAVVTSYHKLSDLKQQKFVFQRLSMLHLKALTEDSSLAFPVSGGFWHSLEFLGFAAVSLPSLPVLSRGHFPSVWLCPNFSLKRTLVTGLGHDLILTW